MTGTPGGPQGAPASVQEPLASSITPQAPTEHRQEAEEGKEEEEERKTEEGKEEEMGMEEIGTVR